MSRALDAVAPPRLGRSFRWLLASSWLSNLGDGFALAAGPLLVASQTDDPLLVALAALLQRIPWLLFGLYAGVVADRHDRRRIVAAVDAARAVVLAVLAVTIVTDAVNVAVVLAAMALLGTAETFADTASATLLPMVVEPDDLGIGNARLLSGHVVANQLAGPSIGAGLFALGAASPFAAQAVLVALGAVLISRIVTPPVAPAGRREPARRDIVAGLRWLWSHAAMRTLTLTIVTFNLTFGAAWAVLVLLVRERLGLGDVGFGALTSVSAVGSVVGTLAYGRLERHVSLADLMRAGLVIETLTHLSLAVNRTPAIAFVTLFVFGMHTAVWGATSTSVRQRAVPAEFQGRVSSVYMVGVFGGLVVGNALGGALARLGDVTTPFWFAFVGSALILALIWRELGHIAHGRVVATAP